MAFPETKPAEWEVKTSDAPQTGGHCFIDLMHNSIALDFALVDAKSRPDVFGPFIRVTNSYNGLRALAFDIGFYRKVCKNGMIVPESVIRFKFNHLQRDIGNSIRFEIDNQKLSKLKESFQDLVGGLKDCKLPRAYFEILIRGVLAMRKPKDMENRDKRISADWESLNNHLGLLCDSYFMELGDNTYAAFNALTDFASHPPENRCLHRDRHSMQRLAGEWLAKFSQECKQNSFEILEYLKNLGNVDGKRNLRKF